MVVDVREATERDWEIKRKERKSEAMKRELRGSCLKRWDEWIDADGL
jgi:hypothetical protein